MIRQRMNWPSIFLTLLALSILYGVGTTFFTLELERLVERTITPYIVASDQVDQINHDIYSGIDNFMVSNHIRIIGYSCIALMILLAVFGLLTERKGLASLGSIGFILPTYAYFLLHMSFLAGLGVLTALWFPFWGNIVKLGDIAYLPYMILVYPFSLLEIDIRKFLASFSASLGLFIFILGVLAWFYARYRQKSTANFWIYRMSRHPQYLGWILWSYGLMLQVAHRHDTLLHCINPGTSLLWVISTLIIICVALSEEIQMYRRDCQEYADYSSHTPFMFPLPSIISRIISTPFRLILRKGKIESRWDLLLTFVIYLGLIMLISLTFVLFDWPITGWMNWPF
jgi:protein-S-isoprenylcysteine O-methyltransferase Ste14